MRSLFLGYLGYLTFLLLVNEPLRWVGLTPKVELWVDLVLPVAHLLGFIGLTLLAIAAQWPLPWWGLGVALGSYALATELLQRLTATRQAEWMDLLQDGVGIIIGLGVGWFVISLWRSFHKPAANARVQESL